VQKLCSAGKIEEKSKPLEDRRRIGGFGKVVAPLEKMQRGETGKRGEARERGRRRIPKLRCRGTSREKGGSAAGENGGEGFRRKKFKTEE